MIIYTANFRKTRVGPIVLRPATLPATLVVQQEFEEGLLGPEKFSERILSRNDRREEHR